MRVVVIAPGELGLLPVRLAQDFACAVVFRGVEALGGC